MKTKEVVALMNISQHTLQYYEKVGGFHLLNRDTKMDIEYIMIVI